MRYGGIKYYKLYRVLSCFHYVHSCNPYLSCVYCCHLLCICLSYLYLLYLMCICCTMCVLLLLCVYCRYYVCIAVTMCIAVLTLDAGMLPGSQYLESPATGHLDTGFSWFPCVYKRMLRWFPSFQVATSCFSSRPPDLNFLVTFFYICVHVK